MNVTVKGRPGEESVIPIDPERSGSLLLRKCMRYKRLLAYFVHIIASLLLVLMGSSLFA